MTLRFTDCHCMVGKRADRRPGEPWSLEDLLADMDHAGIAEALVVHAWSRDYDPQRGNDELCRQLEPANLRNLWIPSFCSAVVWFWARGRGRRPRRCP